MHSRRHRPITFLVAVVACIERMERRPPLCNYFEGGKRFNVKNILNKFDSLLNATVVEDICGKSLPATQNQ